MNNLKGITDKSIYDAVNQKKFSEQKISDLFLVRGIIISKSTSKEELANYYARMPHGYSTYQRIELLLGSASRADKTTLKRIDVGLSQEDVKRVTNSLDKKIKEMGDRCNIDINGSDISLNIGYSIIDFTRSDFKRVKHINSTMEVIYNSDGNYTIKRSDSEKLEACEKIFIDLICEKQESKGLEKDIHLDEIQLLDESHEKRTKFFESLIHGIDSLELVDVTDVYVFHVKEEEIESEEGSFEMGVHINPDTGTYIQNASLKGAGVLRSTEIVSLYERGFFIWKIKWKLKEKLSNPDIIEIEAQFDDPKLFTGFSYQIKGILKYKANGQYYSTSHRPSSEEKEKIDRLIENAAYSTIKELEDIGN